jgi:hypothetical protein
VLFLKDERRDFFRAGVDVGPGQTFMCLIFPAPTKRHGYFHLYYYFHHFESELEFEKKTMFKMALFRFVQTLMRNQSTGDIKIILASAS